MRKFLIFTEAANLFGGMAMVLAGIFIIICRWNSLSFIVFFISGCLMAMGVTLMKLAKDLRAARKRYNGTES